MAPKYNSNYPMSIKEHPVQSSLFLHPTDIAEILQITNSIRKLMQWVPMEWIQIL